MPPTYVLANARIGPDPSLAAIVIDGRDIVAVTAMTDAPTGTRIDLDGRWVLPGIDDSHLHAYAYGRALTAVDLRPAACVESLRAILVAASPEATGWYRGHGWESTTIHGTGQAGRLRAADIDSATPHGPALLADSTGHAALCNSQALARAGVGPATPDPVGGVIVRDDAGMPTGLLLEAAVGLVAGAVPDITRADRRRAIEAAQSDLLARGIIAVTDPGLGPGATTLLDGTGTLDAVAAYQELDAAQQLLLRTHLMLLFGGLGGTTADAVAQGLDAWGSPRRASRERRLSIDQVKVFADGIPRSRTAWISEPYDDCTHGCLTVAGSTDAERVAELETIVATAALRGWQVGAHCTGDAAISAYVEAVRKTGTGSHLRHYVIHGDLVRREDMQAMHAEGMTLNANPSIRWAVGRRVSAIIGEERNLGKQRLRTAIDAGVNVACASDSPVTDPSWQVILAAAMTRSLRDDPGYADKERITAQEAIATMSRNAAWQSHEDGWRGQIAPGMAADLIVLDGTADWDDPWTLTDLRPSAVLIDGAVVHGELP